MKDWKENLKKIIEVGRLGFCPGCGLTLEGLEQIISQEKEKMIEEIKKIEMPEYQNEGAEHANAGYVRAVEDIINLLQNK